MAIEVELKLKVSDFDKIKEKLDNLCLFTGTFQKYDTYWHLFPKNTGEHYGVRIRKLLSGNLDDIKKESNIVTYKIKEVIDGIEVNEEKEFQVDDSENFTGLLCNLGLKATNSKIKKGYTYKKDFITVELCDVTNLGWFLEAEIILPEREQASITDAKNKLLEFVTKTGLKMTDIEEKPYSKMLETIL